VSKFIKNKMEFKYITSKQMSKVDKTAVKKYGLRIEQMMENAGRNLANFTLKSKPKRVIILYGKGNNGGGGLSAVRHLLIKGIKCIIVPASKNPNKQVKQQLKILEKSKIKPSKFPKIKKGDIIMDALLGYNIKGNPRKKYKELIKLANNSKAKIISLDIPSGTNPDTGEKYPPSINANEVLTLALPKIGLKKIKNVYLANIGIPSKVYSDLKIRVGDYFKNGDIIRVNAC